MFQSNDSFAQMHHNGGDVLQLGDIVITVLQVSDLGTTLVQELNVSVAGNSKVSSLLFNCCFICQFFKATERSFWSSYSNCQIPSCRFQEIEAPPYPFLMPSLKQKSCGNQFQSC